jgi:hypothetical protein
LNAEDTAEAKNPNKFHPVREERTPLNLNSAVKTRSTQSRKDGIAVSEMFTCEVKVQLGL